MFTKYFTNTIIKDPKRVIQMLSVLFILFGSFSVQASHVSGGSIKYKSIGSNRFYVEVAVFRDCSGIQYSASTASVTAKCMPSGGNTVYNLNLLAFVAPTPSPFGGPYSAITFTTSGINGATFNIEEVSDVCDKVLNPSKTPSTRCRARSNSILGYTRFKYSGIITLTRCNYWRLHFIPQCCRNTGSSNITTGGMSVETWFNNLNFPNNSAPDFADEVKPIPSACVGKEVRYGIGTVDNDGDSLRFELACAKGSITSCATYRSGFSATAPGDSFTMNPTNGLIRFVPKTAGKRVVAFWVKEYERCTGTWKAQTLRDVQFRVQACSNNIPKDVSGISNIQGTGVKKLGRFKLQVCNGFTFSFEDTIVDPDASDTLIFNSNHDRVLPGSKMTVIKLKKNKAVVRFTWTASIGNNPVKIFYLVFNDDRCNYPGNGFNVYEIEVRNSTSAGPDQSICVGVDTAFIEGSGGKFYRWKSVYGDSLIWTGANKNVWGDTSLGDTNKRIKFFPNKTTFLEVWSDMRAGCITASACKDRDSIKIVAAKNYNLIKHSDTLICFSDSTIQLFVNPDSNTFKFDYKWDNNSTISNDSISNPFVTPIKSQKYYIEVNSDSGCNKRDSIYVGVTPPMPGNISASTIKNPICAGTSAKINLSLGRLPSKCGSTKEKCVGARNFQTSTSTSATNGSGASGTANWPCPYGGAQASSRQQYLYTAAELNAMGVTAGTIDGLGFNAVSANGVGSLGKYTIKLKCVSASVASISSMTVAGFTTVFNAKTVTPVNGWNIHSFDVNYDYDGTSNLLVDLCWENSGSSTSANSTVAYVSTTNNSVVGYNSSSGACGAQFLSLFSRLNRPTIQLSYCGARYGTEFTYKWTPPTDLDTATIQNPTSSTNKTVKYTVLVTDTFGKCSDTTSITIDVADFDAGPDTSMCPNDTIQLFPTVVSSCSGKPRFKWTPSQYFPNDSVQNPLVSVPKTAMVTVTFSDSCGCKVLDSLKIFADSVKFDRVNINPDCGLMNGKIVFNAKSGFGPFQYTVDSGRVWQTVDTIANLSIGFYDLRVRDSLLCYSDFARDTLFNKGAPQIDSVSIKHVSCGGFSDGELEIFTTGGIMPLQYSIDSGFTWGSSNLVKGLKAGRYKVYAKGNFGCTSFPKWVIITEPDTLFVSFSMEEDSCFQQGNGWAKGIAIGGTPPYNYTWSGKASGASHNPVVASDTVYSKLFAHNKYNLKLLDSNGCGLDTTFTLEEIPEIVIDSSGQIQTTCYGYSDGKIYMKAIGGNSKGGTRFNWQYQFSVDSGATYFDATTGGRPDFAILDSTKSDGINGPIYKGKYKLVVKDRKGCTGSTYLTVKEPPLMVLTTPKDSIRICVNTCGKLEVFSTGGNNTSHTYHWTPTVSNTNVANVCPEVNSLYSIYATDNKGCASNGQILRVDLYDSLRIKTSVDTAICRGSIARLRVDVTGGDGKGYEYLWQPFVDLSSAFIKNPVASPKKDTKYNVKVSDLCGSPAVLDSILVSILPQPVVEFSADSLASCPPLYSKFLNKTNASSRCFWDFGDGSNAETCADVFKTFTRSGKYNVKLTVISVDGCKDSLIKENYINIYRVPVASFSMSPQPTTILQTEVSFKDESEGRITRWEWNFAGYDTSMKRNPKYLFPDEQEGTYPVRLDVYSDLGCADDTIRVVGINAEYYLYIPTSFTPNGDGKNDTWKPLGVGFERDYYHVLVFDRWGKLIFDTFDYDEYWDGTVKGAEEIAPNGVYTWKIITGDKKDVKERHERYGNVTIIK